MRQLAYTRSKEHQDFKDKLALAKITKIVDTRWRDIVDRKPFVTNTFNGSTSLTSFIDDLRTETMARDGWDKLLLVDTVNSNDVNVLERFNSITEAEIRQAKTSRTTEKYNISKYMYIVIWSSISSTPKRYMKFHRDEIGDDGPAFLWYIFKYYHSIVEQTIRTILVKMGNLHEAIEH